jgi:hypothetical protein
VISQFKRQEKLMSNTLGSGNDRTREFFELLLLSEMINFTDPDDTLTIEVEQPTISEKNEKEIIWDASQFLISRKNHQQKHPGLRVLHVKDSDFNTGRIELYKSLYKDYHSDPNNALIPIKFGALTDSTKWIFVRFNGQSFYESESFTIQNSSDAVNIQSVFNLLVYLLQCQQHTFKHNLVHK